MSGWEEQEGGRWIGPASDRAIAFADGCPDRLAAVGFAALLTHLGIASSWFLDEPLVVTAECDRIGVRADRGTDFDTYTVEDSGEDWTLAARILPGSPDLILLVGLTATMRHQLDKFGPALPARAFLRLSEWLMRFNCNWKGAT